MEPLGENISHLKFNILYSIKWHLDIFRNIQKDSKDSKQFKKFKKIQKIQKD